MAIRMMAEAIPTATTVVLDQEDDVRDGPAPAPAPDAGYRPLRAGASRERGGGVTRPTQSARPWPSHVLRAATPDSDASNTGTELPCRR